MVTFSHVVFSTLLTNQQSCFNILPVEIEAQDLQPDKKTAEELICTPHAQKRETKSEKLNGPNVLHVVVRDRMFRTLPPPVVYLWVYHCSSVSAKFFSYFPSIVHRDAYL